MAPPRGDRPPRSVEIKDTEAVGPGRALGELGGSASLAGDPQSHGRGQEGKRAGRQPGGAVSTLVRLRHGAAYGRLPRPSVSSTQPLAAESLDTSSPWPACSGPPSARISDWVPAESLRCSAGSGHLVGACRLLGVIADVVADQSQEAVRFALTRMAGRRRGRRGSGDRSTRTRPRSTAGPESARLRCACRWRSSADLRRSDSRSGHVPPTRTPRCTSDHLRTGADSS